MTAADSQQLLCYLERKPTATAPFPTAGGYPSSDQESAWTSVPRGGGPGRLLGGEHASTKAGAAGCPPHQPGRCRPPLRGPALTCSCPTLLSLPAATRHHRLLETQASFLLSHLPGSMFTWTLQGPVGVNGRAPCRLGGQGLGLPQREAALCFLLLPRGCAHRRPSRCNTARPVSLDKALF